MGQARGLGVGTWAGVRRRAARAGGSGGGQCSGQRRCIRAHLESAEGDSCGQDIQHGAKNQCQWPSNHGARSRETVHTARGCA